MSNTTTTRHFELGQPVIVARDHWNKIPAVISGIVHDSQTSESTYAVKFPNNIVMTDLKPSVLFPVQ